MEETRFLKGNIPWNAGKTYLFEPRQLTEEHLLAIRKARSGENSNFWKGGVTTKRKSIESWTANQGKKIRDKFNFTCQICGKKGKAKLVTHHIIPIWYDSELGKNFDNLVCVHEKCHKNLHAKNLELEFAKTYTGIILSEDVKKTKADKKFVPKFDNIKEIKFAGIKNTFDIEVSGLYKNFIANDFVVHNSGRYKPVADYYIPSFWRKQSEDNKQASDGKVSDSMDIKAKKVYNTALDDIKNAYRILLEMGIAKEQARILLPLSQYTEIYWTASWQAIANFIDLRDHEHAQWEIQIYAKAMRIMAKKLFPYTYAAWFGEE